MSRSPAVSALVRLVAAILAVALFVLELKPDGLQGPCGAAR
jgi:hypothetical protein